MSVKDKDLGFAAIMKGLAGADYDLKVGFIRGKTPDDVILRAAVNEFGSDKANVPSRPFLTPTLDANENKYVADLARKVDFWLGTRGVADLKRPIENLGKEVVSDVKQAILAKSRPRNADSTIAKKGKDDPLVDTFEMHDSVTYEVD